MIKVTIYKTDGHKYAGFDISGHAGYDESGNDVVCAAVSAIVINTINSIERFTEDETSSVSDEESGTIEFRFGKIPSHDASLLLDSMILGLEDIEDSSEYESYIDIIAGVLEETKEQFFSSVVYIDSEGIIRSVYRRVNIYGFEKKFISPGNELVVVKTKWGKIGLLGGYDINFPELCRRYFEEETALMVCLCQIPDTFLISMTTIAKARAAENSCYFVLASNIGRNILARIDFMGNSMIAQGGDTFDFASGEYIPQEEILAIADQEEVVLTARLNMKHKNLEIVNNPHMLDRRMDYSSLEVKYAE